MSKLVSNTKIYLDCTRLFNAILDITPEFPRAYKYSVGNRMHELAIDLLDEIAAAYINRSRDIRVQHLTNFQTKFNTLKTLLRTAGEKKWILGRSKHAEVIELMDAIGKQATAWKNSLTKLDDADV